MSRSDTATRSPAQAIGIGFIGVIVIVRPGTAGFNEFSLLALLSVAFCTVRDLATRRIPTDIPSLFIALLTTFTVTSAGAVIIHPLGGWIAPSGRAVGLLAVAAVLALGVLALVVAYPYIPGSHTDAFKGISILLGVLLSIGSSSAIANIVAGYMITYRRAFREGDRVRIGDVLGDVTKVRLQVTHLRTPKNEEVTFE